MSKSFCLAAIVASLAIATLAMPATAQNQSCDRWTAAVEQREEGKALTASVCAPGKDRDSVLEIVCHGREVNIRYLVVIKNDAEPKFSKQPIEFKVDGDVGEVSMVYEAMDGAFAGYFPTTSPLLTLLMSGKLVAVSATRERLRVPVFTLKGSRKAISRVISKCR